MAKPLNGMTSDAAIALGNVSPVAVFFQSQKDTGRALVAACDQHYFIAFTEFGLGFDRAVCIRNYDLAIFRHVASFSPGYIYVVMAGGRRVPRPLPPITCLRSAGRSRCL